MDEARCRAIVRERSEGHCEVALAGICRGQATNMHHRRKEGRVWEPANVLDACGSGTTGCHGYIESHPTWANEEGLWLRAGDGTPDQVAVHMRWQNARSWWTLDNEGCLHWEGMDFEALEPRRAS